ncbi:MAG: EAL domain-containing response regulator [Candidatus Omnitrophica bacterium]|nr:EAL domain-containing response regulator [Candidatus Omnitrophota bacterium]
MASGINSQRVLVVNDEPAISRLLLLLLGTHGYKATAVKNGPEALKKVNDGVDLILLDLLLPDQQGFEACRLLKSDARTQNIPIIIISANTQNRDKIESFHLGADDYLAKPFEPEELFARIEAVLRRSNHTADYEHSQRQYAVMNELQHIIKHERVIPYFQPIYLLKPMRLFGLEVLSRPQTKGILSDPQEMFKAALRFGLYYQLEMVVWRKALAIATRLFEQEHLFLNCDPYLVESDRFIVIKDMFSNWGMSSQKVFLEITERSAISQYKIFFDRLLDYRRGGFKIAIDDVGGGFASLESIVETRPELIKLDRHIVSGLAYDCVKKSIVKLIVSFCRDNQVMCVAEGIEGRQDLDMLVELGVDAGQGYYLCRPTPNVDLKAMSVMTPH